MHQVEFEIDLKPSRENIQRLSDGLNQHALDNIASQGFKPVAIWARDADGELLGGIQGLMNWNWLHICLLWIAPAQRKQGLGSELLSQLEDVGRQHRCQQAHLDTFSFQAREFYERYGYEVFGCLEDYPAGQSRYYLRKPLNR